MKKFSFLALAAAGLLLGACSDKDEVAQEVQQESEFKDGGYIGISLQLPTADQSITRANDDLSNGTADEFAVKNATLYIFKLAKTSTANPDKAATYFGKVSLGTTYTADKEGPSSDQWGVQNGVDVTNITSTYNQATLIPNALASEMKTDTDNDYYGYVIINHNGQVTVDDGDTFEAFSKQEFTQIGADIAAEKKIYESGLLMTNSPICNYGGGNAAPTKGTGTSDPEVAYTTLVKLDNTKIYGGKTEAENNPAGCIFVERAAVKITVEGGSGLNTTIGEGDNAVAVSILGWQVINNEPKYYNTRQIEAAWGPYFSDQIPTTPTVPNYLYRFVSKNKFDPSLPASATHTKGYRTYFAKDLNFDADATLANTVASDDRPWIAVGKHAYTTENTFDVGRQTWRNTTMVTLKVQIGNGTTDFYTVGKDGQTMYTQANALAAIENYVKGVNEVAQAMDALLNKISANNPTKTVTSGLTVTITAPSAGKTDVPFTITPAYKIADNSVTPASIADADYQGTGELALKTALETEINKAIKVTTGTVTSTADPVVLSYFKDGISYYNVRIQHFGEVETPWSATGAYISGGGKNVKEIYGYDITQGADDAGNVLATQRFLGRYGVVRDNWYKLSIDKIGKIGSAQPVDPSTTTPDTPDDEIENFLSVHVHIVPWVLRSQSVQF